MATRRRLLAAAAMGILALAPTAASAQASGPFTDIAPQLDGRTIVVIETNGDRIRGRVVSVAPGSVVLMVHETGAERTFAAESVREIKRPGPIWDGAAKGAAIGGLLGLLIGGNYGEHGAAAPGALMGAGIGLGIDALFPAKRIYRASARGAGLTVAPVVTRTAKGVNLSVQF